MEEPCFYCDHPIEEGKKYYAPFLRNGEEKEELLCTDCYLEWLVGIKE
jgi:hypothetical protein